MYFKVSTLYKIVNANANTNGKKKLFTLFILIKFVIVCDFTKLNV